MTRLPRKITYDLGRDEFGRKLELVEEGLSVPLIRHASSQRDETIWLDLTRDQALAIGEALSS